MLSSPTSGLDQQFVGWWPTIRGMDTSAIRLMESYLKKLSIEITAEAELADKPPMGPTLNQPDAEEMKKKK